MVRKIRYRTRELIQVRLKHSRRIYRTRQGYEGWILRKIVRFPRLSSGFFEHRFYIDVKPFCTTRYENER